MLQMGIFKKKQPAPSEPDEETLQAVFDLVDKSSMPLSSNAIHRLVNDKDVDRCLRKLTDKKWIEVAYEKHGLDGIIRPYYRVSERYNLIDAKEKISGFISSIVRRSKPIVDNNHNYLVKVPKHKEFTMIFDIRQQARDYKRLLKESRMRLDSEIWEQLFDEGYQLEERKIS